MVAIFHIPETLEECTIELNGHKLETTEVERSGASQSSRRLAEPRGLVQLPESNRLAN